MACAELSRTTFPLDIVRSKRPRILASTRAKVRYGVVARPRIAAFVQWLGELNWAEGRSIKVEYRSAEGVLERAGEIAVEFVRLNVDVIVTAGDAQVLAAKWATEVIPIVIAAAGDPIGHGLVASLARPCRQRHCSVTPANRYRR